MHKYPQSKNIIVKSDVKNLEKEVFLQFILENKLALKKCIFWNRIKILRNWTKCGTCDTTFAPALP